jgi:uncharacterized protein involved in exopolysaccharide biosynthesis
MIRQTATITTVSLRDGVSVAFRRRRLVMTCLAVTLLAAVLAAIFLPRYHAEAKILVDRERVDPLLSPTPETNNFALAAQPIVTDEDLRSEVELMKSTEVLTEVVKGVGLADSGPAAWWDRLIGQSNDPQSNEKRVSAKVNQLARNLVIEPAKGSYIIDIVYKSKDRQLAQRVMDKLVQVYMAKHTEVHHPAGQYTFFEQQANEYRKRMEAAQAKLADFPSTTGSVAPEMDRELTMQKLAEFKFSLAQTQAAIAESSHRIQRLIREESSTPDRITTQVRKADNPQLLEQLKGTMLTLELKRSELLSKYQPDYRPVQEVTEQIAQTRAAIQHELSTPMNDVTTDLDQTHQMVRSDLARQETELDGLKARAAETQAIVVNYSDRVRQLDTSALQEASLQRNLKAEIDNYLLYRRKSEEARITDALDAHRMVNVTVAEHPLVPALPSHSPLFFGALALIAMMVASYGLIWSAECMDRTFHTPYQLEAYLGIPVLVAVPRQFKTAGFLPSTAEGEKRSVVTWITDTTPSQKPVNSHDGSDKERL